MPGLDVRVRGAVTAFGARDGSPALDGADLDVEPGSCHAIVGESASGKSTLARVVLGSVGLRAGSARAGPFEHPLRSPADRRSFGRSVGWVAKDATGSLDPRRPVWWSITEGARFHGLATRSGARAAAVDLLRRVDLPGDLADRVPAELSGGQCQRVCIARAIACGPSLLVADEPLSALDPILQVEVLRLLGSIGGGGGLTLVLVSHGLAAVRAFCDTVTVMSRGRAVESGPAGRVLAEPMHPATQALVRAEREMGE